jgi:hypothetical protein
MLRRLPTSLMTLLVVSLVAAAADAQSVSCGEARLEAERLAHEGAYQEAGMASIALVRDRPDCGGRDEVLWNAAVYFQSAGSMGRAMQVRQVLMNNFPSSPLVPRTLFILAGNYHALAMYGEAAQQYAQFAERYPVETGAACTAVQRESGNCPIASDALENAIFFFLALGRLEEAEEAAQLYARNYGHTLPEPTASVAFSIVRAQEDPERMATHAEAFLTDYASIAPLDQQAGALVLLAHARRDQERPADAAAAFARVLALVTPEALAAITGSPADVALRTARTRDALAEARFSAVETREITLAAAPRYTGPHTEAGLRAWIAGPFSAWRDRQLTAMASALEASSRVRDLEIPAWTIASFGYDGDLRAQVLAAAQAVEVPSWAAASETEAVAFEQARTAALADLSLGARESYAQCAGLAHAVRWPSERSEHCEEALVTLDPAQHASESELHGAATWLDDTVAPPGVAATPPVGPRTPIEPSVPPTSDADLTGAGTAP